MPPTTIIAAAATQSPERTTQPKRKEVISRIVAECRAAGVVCSRDRAGGLIEMLKRIAVEIGDAGGRYYFSQRELDLYHRVLDVVMPDNFVQQHGPQIPAGSAHAGINSLALSGRQITFEHTKARVNGRDHCVVEAHIRVV